VLAPCYFEPITCPHKGRWESIQEKGEVRVWDDLLGRGVGTWCKWERRFFF